MRRLLAGSLLIVTLLAGACSTPEKTAEDSSSLACEHFRNVMGDVRDGVLTDSELRSKFKEIDDNAVIGTPAVQAAARSMLAAATSGESDAVLSAATEMDAACDAAGH